MSIHVAYKTILKIETEMEADQGAAFRIALGTVVPHMKDAYRGVDNDGGFRKHLGASVLGKDCARAIWYGWRWSKRPRFSGRMQRLFNRGHAEEARFIAMFLSISVAVFQQDANGNQFRISELGGHLGGSGDGIVVGLPDLNIDIAAVLEVKTHGEKSFLKLAGKSWQKHIAYLLDPQNNDVVNFDGEGVRVAKYEHFVQMQIYMRKMNIIYAIYCAVNKNTDDVYMEIVMLDTTIADSFLDRGHKIIMMQSVPPKIPNASMGLFACRFCDLKSICHENTPKEKNCRTCYFGYPKEDGTWNCRSQDRLHALKFQSTTPDEYSDGVVTEILSHERQLKGCQKFYTPI